LYCRSCWNTLSPDEKAYAKKTYYKALRQGFGLIAIFTPLLFAFYALPIIFWRHNEPLYYTSLILGTILLFVTLLVIIDHYRKKHTNKDKKSTNKDKKILKIVMLFMCTLVLLVIIIAVVIMMEFNARWD
jgi:MFS family permease